MPEGGVITLKTRKTVPGEHGSVPGHLMLEVTDTGTGMTDEVREKCLEPFFSTKGERGTGMGLAMVFGIIQRHQGTLDIVSSSGKGTTFRIFFPVPASRPVVDTKIQKQGLTHTLHVLVVDADSAECGLIARYLKQDGHTPETSDNGRKGLEKFHQGQFDVVITDRNIPEMDGLHLARAIRDLAPRKPIILITDEDASDNEEEVDYPDISMTLRKPLILQLFRLALKQAVDSATLH
jgi:CheY-like chemotaxis protein